MKGLKRTIGLRWLHMENLKANITAGIINYDAMVARVEQSERTKEQERVHKLSKTLSLNSPSLTLDFSNPHFARTFYCVIQDNTQDKAVRTKDKLHTKTQDISCIIWI